MFAMSRVAKPLTFDEFILTIFKSHEIGLGSVRITFMTTKIITLIGHRRKKTTLWTDNEDHQKVKADHKSRRDMQSYLDFSNEFSQVSIITEGRVIFSLSNVHHLES